MLDAKIRKMEINDYKQVHILIEQVHNLHLKQRPDIYRDEDPISYEEFMQFVKDPNYICYVAEKDKRIIGEIIAVKKEIKEEKVFKHRMILFIDDICVDVEHKRQGIGKKLYEKMLLYAKENNIDSIELVVWSFNTDAIRFYEELGMTPKNIRYEYKIKN